MGGRPAPSRWRCSVRPTLLEAGSTHRMRARSRWLGLQGAGRSRCVWVRGRVLGATGMQIGVACLQDKTSR